MKRTLETLKHVFLFGLLVIGVGLGGYFIILRLSQPSSRDVSLDDYSTQPLKDQLEIQEANSWQQNITVSATSRVNFAGQSVYEGNVFNSASIATFKDPVLRINWYSISDTYLSSHQETIYGYIPSRQSISFKIKLTPPKATAQFSIEVVSITPVNVQSN